MSVPSSDLLVTRSVSTKVKSYHGAGTRSRTQSVPLDNVEALRSLKEEKNNILVSDDAPPHSTYMGKKKGRKRKQDLDNDDLISNPSNVDALYSKVSGISAPKDSFDSKNTGGSQWKLNCLVSRNLHFFSPFKFKDEMCFFSS